MKHLLDIRNLDRSDVEELLRLSARHKKSVIEGTNKPAQNPKVIGLLFFEGSTRTRVSFEQAANYLGHRTCSFAAAGSSISKGETLRDTVLTLRYERLDALVMRHRACGAPSLAARYFGGPVINAGDGQHEHPTQALADALTIIERKGGIKGLRIAIVGDVAHSRVARSNAWMFAKLGAEVRFVGPRTLMPPHTSHFEKINVLYDLADGISGADVVMCLRLQKERMDEGLLSSEREYARLYQVNRSTLKYAKPDCIVMHPGPLNRGIEVDDAAADGENSAITQQVENGVFVRMAAIEWVIGNNDAQPTKRAKSGAKVV